MVANEAPHADENGGQAVGYDARSQTLPRPGHRASHPTVPSPTHTDWQSQAESMAAYQGNERLLTVVPYFKSSMHCIAARSTKRLALMFVQCLPNKERNQNSTCHLELWKLGLKMNGGNTQHGNGVAQYLEQLHSHQTADLSPCGMDS